MSAIDDAIELIFDRARIAGAAAAVNHSEGDEWETVVANGAIEAVESARTTGLSLRIVLPDGRSAHGSTSDCSIDAVRQLVEDSIVLAREGEADEHRSLPDPSWCGLAPVAGLDDGGKTFDSETATTYLLEAEALARQNDARIIGTQRCSIHRLSVQRRRVTSDGVDLSWSGSRYGAALVLVAEEGGEKQMGYDQCLSRSFSGLKPGADLAATACRKATEGFGWQRPPSGEVRVLFDPWMASALIGAIAGLASGTAAYQGGTCWADRLGSQVAIDGLTLVDDPLIAGGIGSRPCDGEGVRSQSLPVIENGVLRHFLCDTYAARRLGRTATGHQGGTSNWRLHGAPTPARDLPTRLDEGLLLTRVHGHGVDLASGQWSKGASGFWVSGGRIHHPVQECTLAGRLDTMLQHIIAIGDDPLPDVATSSPSLLIEGLTLAGS